MYDTELKLSNFCAHWFEYYYRKHHNQVELFSIDKKLSKLMDNELLEYFSNKNNVRKYINNLLIDMFTNFRQFYPLNYNSTQEKEIKDLLQLCSNDLESLNTVVDDLVNKNLEEINNSIEIYKSNNGGTLVTDTYNFYQYMQRKLGIESTYDENKNKNEKLKKRIIDENYFSDEEINIISKFADVGYGWMLIWKNIDKVKVMSPERINSAWENEKKGYIGIMSGDLVIKDRITIFINDIKFTRDISENISTAGFW